MKRGGLARATALAMALASGVVLAQTGAPASTPGPAAGYGPGMMRGYGYGMGGYGYGPGMMGGYGPGGYGPGMMRGYGYGMGGYGYGPGYSAGMMGAYGPGMMGGYGYGGWGHGYGNVLSRLDLSADQQEKIARIQEDMRAKNWNTMGQLHTEQFKLRELYSADKPDANAIAEQQKKVDDLRRTMIKSHVDARNQIAGVLTKEQREQLRAIGPQWLDDDANED